MVRGSGAVGPEEAPPPYGSICAVSSGSDLAQAPPNYQENQVDSIIQTFSDLDLLATCKNCNTSRSREEISRSPDQLESQQVENSHALEMGQKTSLLTGRHRSKVSLTWVLRERSDLCDNSSLTENLTPRESREEKFSQKYQRGSQKYSRNVTRNDREHLEKHRNTDGDRVIGRNPKSSKLISSENVHRGNKSVKNNSAFPHDQWADFYGGFESSPSTKKHRHKRRKSRTVEKNPQNFGYEIKDIDIFLTEATIDNPGNIPVVVTYPSVLYQTQTGSYQRELSLSLGMVVNAVFKNQQWLYVQTPHGEEGYILYASILPLGILPPLQRSQPAWKAAPCWESTLDLYPQPCGNMTDSEKEQLRGGTKSECGRSRPKPKFYADAVSAHGEKTFDKLYLKATSSCPKLRDFCDNSSVRSVSVASKTRDLNSKTKIPVRKKKHKYLDNTCQRSYVTRHTLLVVEIDYEGSKSVNTLSVGKGDVVILLQGDGVEADVDSEWFYVRNKEGVEGFIPAAIAGHGFL